MLNFFKKNSPREEKEIDIESVNYSTGKQWYRIGFIVVIFGVLYFIVKK